MTFDRASGTQITSGSEGNKRMEQTTMTASNFLQQMSSHYGLFQSYWRMEIGRWSLMPSWTMRALKLWCRAQLGLQGNTERVTVNVLNGQVETLETHPVTVELESVTGDVKLGVTAYTATRVTETLSAFDWAEFTQRWSHLRHISFPSIA